MKSIILTGISRGLGKALHDKLSSGRFAHVRRVFISRQTDRRSIDECVSYINIDLSEKIIDVNKILVASDISLMVFISNAGTVEPINIASQVEIQDIETALRVNCLSPLRIAQHLTQTTKVIGAELLIVNISSGAANTPVLGWIAYCVSKASVKMAFDVLAAENSHVNVLHFDPGVMDTDMQKTIRNQTEESMPDVKTFRNYKSANRLKSTSKVATEIIDIIEGLRE